MGCKCAKTHETYGTLKDNFSVTPTASEKPLQEREIPLKDVVDILNRTHLFRHIPKDEKIHVLLAKACVFRDFEPGQVIVKQGETGDSFFAIRSGRVSVFVDRRRIDTWRDGADFGEHALLHDEPRHATITAETHVETLMITRSEFWRLGLNRKLQFEGRKAVKAGIEQLHCKEPSPKTDDEKVLIADALRNNENLQAMVTLDDMRIEQLMESTWKHEVKAGKEIMVEGDMADCFYVIQTGAFTRMGGATTTTEGQDADADDSPHAMPSSDSYPGSDLSNGTSVKSRHSPREPRSPRSVRSGPFSAKSDNGLNADGSSLRWSASMSTTSREGPKRLLTPHQLRSRSQTHLVAGDCFGEVALLYCVPRTATVIASEDSVLWGIDRKHFKDIVQSLEEEQLQRYMEYMDVVEYLHPLQAAEKHELAEVLVEMHYTKGECIVIQGEPVDACHFFFEGEVEVVTDTDGVETKERLTAGFVPPVLPVAVPVPAKLRPQVPCWAAFLCWGNKPKRRRSSLIDHASSLDLALISQHLLESPRSVTSSSGEQPICHVFGEASLADNPEDAHTCTVQVCSETAKTMALFQESFQMLIGDVSTLEKTRSVRSARKLSLRGAVRHVTLENLLKNVPLMSSQARTGTIQSSCLKRCRGLGRGAFGAVELWSHSDGREFAMKIMSKGHISAMSAQQNVTNERNVMLMTDLPFIVKLHEVYNGAAHVYFLMEFVNGGELYTVYNRVGLYGSTLPARFYTASIVCAFEHLHILHILYRDLKPENMLLTATGQPKLTDFGLATFSIGVTHTFCGTSDYIAPEMIKGVGYTLAIDWWCLGVLTFELLSGSPPFESVTPMQTYKRVIKGIGDVQFPAKCQGVVSTLIKSLLQAAPSDRLPMRPGGIKNITGHQWYRDFQWEAFRQQTLKPPYVPGGHHAGDETTDDTFNTFQEKTQADESYEDDGTGWDIRLGTMPFTGFYEEKVVEVEEEDDVLQRPRKASKSSVASTSSANGLVNLLRRVSTSSKLSSNGIDPEHSPTSPQGRNPFRQKNDGSQTAKPMTTIEEMAPKTKNKSREKERSDGTKICI